MYQFKDPKLIKMHNGNYSLELTEEGTWENFPVFAENFINQIEAQLIDKTSTPSEHIWKIEYKNNFLNLVYEDYPNSISIEPIDNNNPTIDELFKNIIMNKNKKGF